MSVVDLRVVPRPRADWLAVSLRRFDSRWTPSLGTRAVDERYRTGLQRISADDARVRLTALLRTYRAERGRLHAVARQLLGAHADLAEDLVQEVMRKVCQNPPTMREPGKEAPFLFQAVRNEAVTVGTRAGRERHRRGPDDQAVARLADRAAGVEDPVVFHLVLTRALAALSPRERALVELVDVRGMTIKDAAAELGIALGTAKNYRFVALRRLRADPDLADLHHAA
ncbi:hypothetical protein GCM10023201_33560 [Actinomycetospora corticicola]|uniref:RNA polymerase sigma factor (Sigma-70 family) n=1 Tax=Actinomycetospora corticicola TaxID=663602 RepID=A0A7Y9J442_9PSEU|nr:RNA polymerase sigma factor [Actinomycetospora corticicola]NYD34521.1 RNA polymerase sigma factor (sigma-70 family) [Actinomycetospora corticicola]